MTKSRFKPKSSRSLISTTLVAFGIGLLLAGTTTNAVGGTPESLCASLRKTLESVQRGRMAGTPQSEVLHMLDMQEGLSGSPDARALHRMISKSVGLVYRGFSPAEIQESCLRVATSEMEKAKEDVK